MRSISLQLRSRGANIEIFLHETSHEEPRGWRDPAFANPDQPVVGVNWFDAVAYCEWLTAMKAATYRLPTEAEWEKACRGGNAEWEYAWGNEPPESIEYFQGEWNAPRPVGSWQPNGFALVQHGRQRPRVVHGLVCGRLLCDFAGRKSCRPALTAHAAFRVADRGDIRSRDRAPHIAAVCRRSFGIRIMGFVWCGRLGNINGQIRGSGLPQTKLQFEKQKSPPESGGVARSAGVVPKEPRVNISLWEPPLA